MKKVIFPAVCAILLIFVINSVNSNLEAAGYVFAAAFGLLVGSLINRLVFKKDYEENSDKDSVAK